VLRGHGVWIHMGALVGTINVFLIVIIPNQRCIVAA
jgi:uncharacterized membrane protein